MEAIVGTNKYVHIHSISSPHADFRNSKCLFLTDIRSDGHHIRPPRRIRSPSTTLLIIAGDSDSTCQADIFPFCASDRWKEIRLTLSMESFPPYRTFPIGFPNKLEELSSVGNPIQNIIGTFTDASMCACLREICPECAEHFRRIPYLKSLNQ